MGLDFGVHFAPSTVAEAEPVPSKVSSSVPVCAGSAIEIESKKTWPDCIVVTAKERFDPSEEVHAVPEDGEFELPDGVKPIHGLH